MAKYGKAQRKKINNIKGYEVVKIPTLLWEQDVAGSSYSIIE